MTIDELTEREERILLLISEGQTNRIIADAMGYTPGTVRNMVSVILAKLHLRNRAELAVYAVTRRSEDATPDTPSQVMAEILDRLDRYACREAETMTEALFGIMTPVTCSP